VNCQDNLAHVKGAISEIFCIKRAQLFLNSSDDPSPLRVGVMAIIANHLFQQTLITPTAEFEWPRPEAVLGLHHET
jgi:hypothetical protein